MPQWTRDTIRRYLYQGVLLRRHHELNNVFRLSDAKRQAEQHLISLQAGINGPVSPDTLNEGQATFDSISLALELKVAHFQTIA